MLRLTTDKKLANLLNISQRSQSEAFLIRLRAHSNLAYETGFNDGLGWEDIQDGQEIAEDEWNAREGKHGSDFILNLVRGRKVFEEDVFTPLP